MPSSLDVRCQGLEPSATLAIHERSARLAAQPGQQVFRLGLGQSPFPVPSRLVARLAQAAAEKDYLPVAGWPPLRQAVARDHARRDGLPARADEVLIGPGSKELLYLAQLSCQATVLLPSPSWVSYAPQAALAGRTVRWLETSPEQGWRLQPETLHAALSELQGTPALLILNYPSNPCGTTLDLPLLESLGEVCRRFGCWVIADEIYGELHHRAGHRSLASVYPEGTVLCSGLSKWCGAGGWRLGTMRFPPELAWWREAILALASETFTSVCAPVQMAAVEAFDGSPEIESYLVESRRVLKSVGEWCWRRLTQSGLQVAHPEGGFYLFPSATPLQDILAARGVTSGDELCRRLLDDTGVATLPGSAFGRPKSELTFRLAYVDFDGGVALEAAVSMGGALAEDFPERYAPRVVEAIRRLCGWLTP